MKLLTIDNPSDKNFPLEDEVLYDPYIVYHGTNSCFSYSIEKDGWNIEKPFYLDDVKFVSSLFESCQHLYSSIINSNENEKILPYLSCSYAILHHVANKEEINPCFSQNYWHARNYAFYRGGETIDALLNLTEFLLNHPECIPCYGSELKPKINALENINEKYSKLVEGSYPIVYAVRVKQEWFENFPEGEIAKNKWAVDLVATTPIKPKFIIARIDFPKGIVPYIPLMSDGPIPRSFQEMKMHK